MLLSTAVLLLCCWCGAGGFDGGGGAAVSRLFEDEALSRTQQARYAVLGVFAILCFVGVG